MGEHITRPEWLARRGIGPALDHGILSPSGRVSAPARRAALARLEAAHRAEAAAQAEYQRLVDAGEIVDPSGAVRHTPQIDPREAERARLGREAERLGRDIAYGVRPRASRRGLAAVEARRRELGAC